MDLKPDYVFGPIKDGWIHAFPKLGHAVVCGVVALAH